MPSKYRDTGFYQREASARNPGERESNIETGAGKANCLRLRVK